MSAEHMVKYLKQKKIILTPRAIRKRIKSLESKQIIKKYVTVFDETVTGAIFKRLVLIKFQNNGNFLQRIEDYKKYINDSPFCIFALRVTGDFDWLHYKCFPIKDLADHEDNLFRTIFGDIIKEHRIYDVEVTKNLFNQINDENSVKSFLKKISKEIVLS